MDYNKLIGREPIDLKPSECSYYLKNKRVLITGAGGSIGSELSKQMLFSLAERLYLFDHSEQNLFEIDRDLSKIKNKYSLLTHIEPVVGELQDPSYIDFIIKRLNVDIVFHAAAHKHVFLSERNPVETIKNNVFGTLNLINSCKKFNVSKFILISTDKAVEPISIYGASKFLAEELVLNEFDSHRFLIVRFGNVIGSSGSVIPIFEEQIKHGKPLTVSSKLARRYFMTIEEAVSLVIRVGDVGLGGELYILDMGEQVYIEDIAKKLMKLYNREDLNIEYVGLKKGEKKEEKLYFDDEEVESTDFPGILRAKRVIRMDIKNTIRELAPICFFDHNFPELYRNRIELRKSFNKILPTIKMGNRRY